MNFLPGRPGGAGDGRGTTIHALVGEQARRTPAAPAVVAPDGELDYAELVLRARGLARRLSDCVSDQGPDTAPNAPIVGVCLERSLELPVALLGVLEAGAAYLPLDPAYPEQRLAHMLADSGAAAVVCSARTEERVRGAGVRCVLVGEVEPQSGGAPVRARDEAEPDSALRPAYVIYTSGSTGEPKGVVVPHSALVNHARAMAAEYAITSADRVLQFASPSFDVAAEELFPTWIRGATVVMRDEATRGNFAAFRRFLADKRVTVVNLPTPFWQEWTAELARARSELPPALRLVVTGSERVLPARLALWKKIFGDRVRWLNAYGPTETTISATVWEPPAGALDAETLAAASVPIGRAIAGVLTYVLDERLQPVADGAQGELYIGGAGVALGYLNRPELTAERFLEDPFAPSDSGGRMYKTGDLARVRTDGAIEFHGRGDEQVKLRGYRIELGEIEAALAEHAAVREAAVILREDAPGSQRLVGYVAAPGSPSGLESELTARLAARLPEYMRPSEIVRMEALPRLPGGKVDRRALAATRATGPRAGYVAPQGELEQRLAALWERLLGVQPIGRDDDFFELGGHSLLGTQMPLVIDGVYTCASPFARPVFHAAPPLEDGDVEELTRTLRRRIVQHLRRRGVLPREGADPSPADEAATEQPLLALISSASVQGRSAHSGEPDEKIGRRRDVRPDFIPGELCSEIDGFTLHARTVIAADDRDGLERLSRYIARPPIASERLSLREDGRVVYRLRHPWRDGTSAVAFDPLTFIERLAALVPRPRSHMLTYHGVLAPAASWRDLVVPAPALTAPSPAAEPQPSSPRENASPGPSS